MKRGDYTMLTNEQCPYCDDNHLYEVEEAKLEHNYYIVKCRTCKRTIKLCSICEHQNCGECEDYE